MQRQLLSLLVAAAVACGLAADASPRTGVCGPQKELLDALVEKYKDAPVRVELRCLFEEVPAENPATPPQCCCYFSHEPRFKKCLPHAIIVGAQKAGTTALFGHMLLRSDFEKPKRKEVSYFGKREQPTVLWYLRHMPPHQPGKVGWSSCMHLPCVVSSVPPLASIVRPLPCGTHNVMFIPVPAVYHGRHAALSAGPHHRCKRESSCT